MHRVQTCGSDGRRRAWGMDWDLGLEMWTITAWINNNVVLCSIGNYIQYPVISHSEWKSLSHVWLCNSMDYSPLGSSVHRILQARILEWVAIPFSRGSSWPRDQTSISCIVGRFFTIWATREVHLLSKAQPKCFLSWKPNLTLSYQNQSPLYLHSSFPISVFHIYSIMFILIW